MAGEGISILVPLRLDDPNGVRARNWEWLKKYWEAALPEAEIVLGDDPSSVPFSKSAAVNDAASRANGDIFAVLDADIFLAKESMLHAAEEIRLARSHQAKLWFVPYRQLYRLTEAASNSVTASDPANPRLPSCPPPLEDFSNTGLSQGLPASRVGHWYGAMAQIFPREAYYTVGGWDPRFKGWGGEDQAAMLAMDTLYSPHKTLPSAVFHVWHPVLTRNPTDNPAGMNRIWPGQDPAIRNSNLFTRYHKNQGIAREMRKLVNEFLAEDLSA